MPRPTPFQAGPGPLSPVFLSRVFVFAAVSLLLASCSGSAGDGADKDAPAKSTGQAVASVDAGVAGSFDEDAGGGETEPSSELATDGDDGGGGGGGDGGEMADDSGGMDDAVADDGGGGDSDGASQDEVTDYSGEAEASTD